MIRVPALPAVLSGQAHSRVHARTKQRGPARELKTVRLQRTLGPVGGEAGSRAGQPSDASSTGGFLRSTLSAATAASASVVGAGEGLLGKLVSLGAKGAKTGGAGAGGGECGVGLGLTQSTDGRFLASKMVPGGSAERCGEIRVGDELVSVNGASVEGLTLKQVVTLIKGLPSTKVVLGLRRGDFGFDVSLSRPSAVGGGGALGPAPPLPPPPSSPWSARGRRL